MLKKKIQPDIISYMTPENPSFVVSEVLGNDAIMPTPDDLAAIRKLQTQGKSLGASVSTHMLNESNSWLSDLEQRLYQEPKLEKTQLAQRLLAIAVYKMIPSAFLDAEEVVRSNEPQPISKPDPEQELLGSIVTKLTLDLTRSPVEDPTLETVAEINLYLKKLRLGDILKQTNSPLAVTNQAYQNTMSLIQNSIQKSLQEKNEGKKEIIQKSLEITLHSLVQSQIRFGLLYDSSQQPPKSPTL